jgi:hypothetical protein
VARRLPEGQAADRILRARLAKLGLHFEQVLTDVCRVNATHGPLASPPQLKPPEVQLRIGVRSKDRLAVERFTKEIAPLILTGPPAVTGFAGGRPKVEEDRCILACVNSERVITPTVEVFEA